MNELIQKIARLFCGHANLDNPPSSSDIVSRDALYYMENVDKIVIDLNGLPFLHKVWMPSIPDTNSMIPTFDVGHNNILVAGIDKREQKKLVDFLKVGHIAVYQNDYGKVIHRIVKIEHDEIGRKFTFRGDNCVIDDPCIVRDEHIKWISLGTIY